MKLRSIAHLLIFFACVQHPLVRAQAEDKQPEEPKPPQVLLAVPLGAVTGQTTKIILRGQRLEGATEVCARNAEVQAKVLSSAKADPPNGLSADQVGDTQVEIEVTIPEAMDCREVALRVTTPTGESEPLKIPVDQVSPTAEKEPNPGFKQCQAICQAGTIAGTIGENNDVDVYRLDLPTGAKWKCEVQANRLGSPLDPVLVLYGSDRRIIKTIDDTDERDTSLELPAGESGAYYLGLIDAHESGSPLHVYRLVIQTLE